MLFSVVDAKPKHYAASPTIVFRLRIGCDDQVEAMVLRVQIRIEPRRHNNGHPFAWADIPVMVPAFTGETFVDVNVPCTYDFDNTAARFFNDVEAGEIPLRFFFTGSIFRRTEESFSVSMLSWQSECAYRMPLEVWQDAMRACYGDSVLIRIDRETFERLQRLRTQTGATSWDAVL
jgi:hypothetical protein